MKLKSFSLKEKIGGYLSDSFPPCYQKKKEPLFFGEAGKKKVSLYAIHISFTRVYS